MLMTLRNRIGAMVLVASVSCGVCVAQAFQHPGVLVSGPQLDFVKAQVKAKAEPFYSEYRKAAASEYGSLNYQLKGPPSSGVIECGSYSRPDNGCHAEDDDASAAYLQSVLWYISGDHRYADNAMRIVNAYSHRLSAYTNSNAPLQAAWSGEMWPRSAEILRYSNAGWKPEDVAAFTKMLQVVILPLVQNGSGSNGNWELSMIEAMMGIAVFTDDHALLDHAATMWKQRVPSYYYDAAIDGSQPVPAPRGKSLWAGQTVFDQRVNGIPQEACRDFHHTSYGISATMAAAETAHIQGLKLYESEEPRLIAGMEFVAYYQLKKPVPDYVCGGKLKLATGSTFVIGYNEYHNRLSQPMPYTAEWISSGVLPNPLPTDVGGHTTIFEPLTHFADASSVKALPPAKTKAKH